MRLFYWLSSWGFGWILSSCFGDRLYRIAHLASYSGCVVHTGTNLGQSGIRPVSVHFDAVGGMAKPVIDLATITDCLLESNARIFSVYKRRSPVPVHERLRSLFP